MSPATVIVRKRLIAALAGAGGETSTPELCAAAGFNNFEHHAYVLPQLRALARTGVVSRMRREPGGAVYWQLNTSDQDDEVLNARLEASP